MQTCKYQNRTKKRTGYLLTSLMLCGLAILLSGCLGKQLPEPTETVLATQAVMVSPTPAATPTIVGLAKVSDNGAPLAPRVVSQNPLQGQEISPRAAILVTFDQPMDQAKTAAAWKVVNLQGVNIQGEITWPDVHTLRFTPAVPLQTATTYRASLGAQAASQKGVAVDGPFDFQFNTAGELQVNQVFPAADAQDVANNAVITVIFNRPVVPLMSIEQQAGLPNPIVITPTLAGKGEWVNTSVFAFRPDKYLKGGIQYSVSVKAGLADAAGDNRLADDYTWSFTTTPPSWETLTLSNGTSNPADNLSNVLLDEWFRLSFHEAMDPASVESALALASGQGEAVSLRRAWNSTDTELVFTPTQRLALNTAYNLTMSQAARAADGGQLQKGLSWHFSTVPTPAVKSVHPENGTRQSQFDGSLRIEFTSPMRISSVTDKVVITPKPDTTPLQWYYNDYDWSISAYILKPSTQYQVRLLPGMMDIYSNTINAETSFTFSTATYDPQVSLEMPYMPALFRVGGPQEFYVSHVNLKQLQMKLFSLKPDGFVSLVDGSTSQYSYTPPVENLVWQQDARPESGLNLREVTSYTLSTKEGQPLAPGFYFLTLDSPQLSHKGNPYADTRLLVVADTNLTLKATDTEALVWLTGLASGQPVTGLPVTIYNRQFQPIGQGTSGADGLASIQLSEIPSDPYEQRYAMVTSGDHFAFVASGWSSGVSPYDFGVSEDYYAPRRKMAAYVYTDRPIYRPGQPVYFKGIVRSNDDLSYGLPDIKTISVTVENYEGTRIYGQELPLNALGTFTGKLDIDPQAALGYYMLNVRIPQTISNQGKGEPSQDAIGSINFSVAEYRRPEFQVNVTTGKTDVVAGGTFTVSVQADFYSGGGVANAAVHWSLTATPYFFQPGGANARDLQGYTFTDYEDDAESPGQQQSSGNEVVAEGDGQTDASGRLVLTLPADLSKVKTGRKLTLEATVTDLAGSAVSGRATITAHRSAVYTGIKPKTYVGIAGQESGFDLVAVDWNSQLLPGQSVTVDIVERRWYSVQQQDASGRIQWSSSVQDIPVKSFNNLVMDAQGKGSVPFIPPNGGVFRAKASAKDAAGNPTTSSAYLWVSGPDYVPWRQTNDRSFRLIADHNSYSPGETAEILIASPFQGQSYALVTVERGHIRAHEVVALQSNSTLYKLPITADMAPNVYVSVLVVKGIDDTNPRPNYKVGMTEIKVLPSQQTIQVEISTDKPQAGPGDKVAYTVHTRDASGQPVSAEVSLGLSDLATLSLADPNSSPILDYFYSRRSLSVWTAIPIGMSIEDYNAEIKKYIAAEGKGMGSGGGKGGGDLGVIAVRQNFPDTAFWQAQLQTDASGSVTVEVTLPDNLTTWRMDARAVTQDTHVGQATLDLISTKPLLVRPQTPRFFVIGDQARLGAAIHNNTDQSMKVDVKVDASGLALKDPAVQTVDIPAHQQAFVTWNASVDMTAERVDLTFSASGEAGGQKYTDASRPTLGSLDNNGIPVYRYNAPETVGTSGVLTESGSKTEAIFLPTDLGGQAQDLTIKVSPSLAAGMTDGLDYLSHYPFECVEQTVSRFLPNVITTRALKTAGLSDPKLEEGLKEQVGVALQRLYNWQKADGGWGWWGGGNNDPQTTAYVVLGLVEAKEAGYTVDDNVITRAVKYLGTVIIDTSQPTDPSVLNRQAFILYVQARAGQPAVNPTVKLYDQRQNLALYARAFLAQSLHLIDAGDPRIQTILSDLNSAAITSATGTHWEEKTADTYNWNTDTRTTAILLSTLSSLDVHNPLNMNAVRWLMSSRKGGHWDGTQETAWTLMALTNWMDASGELQANYTYGVALNNQRLGGGIANQDTLRQTLELHVKVTDLLRDESNRLVFARDAGAGNMYYTAHLNVSLPVERIQALDQGIILSRSYFPQKESQAAVTQARQGDLLLVRLTMVVPHALHYVVVSDPLPAGFEAVDTSLNTSQQAGAPSNYTWDDLNQQGWGWWYFTHTEMRDEQVVLSTDYLPAGTYIYTYLARASMPGVYNVIPPTAQEFYFPEVYGRGDGSQFTVTP